MKASATLQFVVVVALLAFILVPSTLKGQAATINDAKSALKVGNSRELSQYFHKQVELNIDGEKSNYSRTQAEFVLKDFFRDFPPVNFEYIHQGASREGLKYTIGKYSYEGGSFRVYMLIKQFDGQFLIDTIDFTKE